jgi:ADP-dependent phosphofructokinase/glucokinase
MVQKSCKDIRKRCNNIKENLEDIQVKLEFINYKTRYLHKLVLKIIVILGVSTIGANMIDRYY